MKNFKIRLARRLVKILIVSLILFFLFKLVNIQNQNIRKEKELQECELKLKETREENEKIKKQIEMGMSDEFKEKLAREELNMIKAGERVIFDVTKE